MLALSATTIVLGIGSGLDLGRAYLAKQELSAVANLTCQFASRDSIAKLAFGPNGQQVYQSKVDSFVVATLADQKIVWPQTNPTPFTYSPGGSGDVSLAARVGTAFMSIVGIGSVPVAATMHCFNQIGDTQQPVIPPPSNLYVQEGFENSACAGSCYDWYTPAGTVVQPGGGSNIAPVNTPPPNAGYAGTSGNQWIIMGYCIEIDTVGVIRSSVPEGTHSAELDCDNDHGSAGNSSISTKIYLQPGNYELRWNYASRLDYPTYDPAYLCGSTASDTSWANAAIQFQGTATRSNQINVYLDRNTTGAPPTHTTLDGTQTLGGSNLVDGCVYATNWVERSVKINVTTASFYWLSFAADGHNDSYGGQIDNLRFCNNSCPGTVQDNFPFAWTSSGNGGTNPTLFEDTFESPSYAYNASGQPFNWNGNMFNSNGTSGSGVNNGWPNLPASGWAMAPINKALYWLSLSPQGTQSLQLDWGAGNTLNTPGNSMISRPFLLDPGYYQVKYTYVPEAVIASLGANVYCGASPAAANLSALSGTATGVFRINNASFSLAKDSQTVGVFMSHAQLASTPNLNATLGSTSSYTNPDGSTSVLPAVAPNAINLTSYTPSTTSPLLDVCGYAPTTQARSVSVLIQKSGYYWLTFAALGTSDSIGGSIDDVRLIGLGSPYMAGPPAGAVVIPVPDPQPGTTLSFSGFSTTADLLTP